MLHIIEKDGLSDRTTAVDELKSLAQFGISWLENIIYFA